MSLTRLFSFIPALFAIVGIVYLATHPGGRLIPFAIGFLCLSLIGAYYGFVSKERIIFRSRLQTGAIILLLITVTDIARLTL